MVSNTIKFVYNNKIRNIKNPDPNKTLLDYIRNDLKKNGTKEGCAEGGCGACTVVLGELKNKRIFYKSINSCISFLPIINGTHLILVENLVSEKKKTSSSSRCNVKISWISMWFLYPRFCYVIVWNV